MPTWEAITNKLTLNLHKGQKGIPQNSIKSKSIGQWKWTPLQHPLNRSSDNTHTRHTDKRTEIAISALRSGRISLADRGHEGGF